VARVRERFGGIQANARAGPRNEHVRQDCYLSR
jgi:hypothetical protein